MGDRASAAAARNAALRARTDNLIAHAEDVREHGCRSELADVVGELAVLAQGLVDVLARIGTELAAPAPADADAELTMLER